MASLQLPNCKKKSAAHKNGFEVLVKYDKYVYLYRTVSVHDLFKAKVIIEVNYDDGGFKLQRSVPS